MNHVPASVRNALTLLLTATLAAAADRYILVLETPPLAEQLDLKTASRSASLDKRAKILAEQGGVRSAVAKAGARVTSANQVFVNGVFIEATAAQAQQLRSAPGVALVEKLRPLKLHLNRALDLMTVRTAWSSVNGEQNAGVGIRIAIIDSGIDNTHPAFQENGLQYPAGYPKCNESRGDCAFVNRKVIAARSYVDLLVGTDPATSRPDDTSPRDRVGHGTAVAMVAAGARNDGPAGAITGVAPRAWLGNYKVFGSPGVNGQYTYDNVIIQALEEAASDGMHIAVMSLGAPAVWGPLDRGATCQFEGTRPCDWRANAIENAAQAGMIVVVSAGNDGDSATRYPGYSSIATPGTAPSAITVGSTTNSHILYQSVQIPGTDRIGALFGDGPRPTSPLTAPLRDVARLQDNGKACSPLTNGSLSGAIALIERGDCSNISKIQNAQRAGAVGVIIYQGPNVQGVFQMSGLEETSIPAVIVGNRNGETLKTYAGRSPDGPVTLDPALYEVPTDEYDTIDFISARGPSIRENAIKPELVAVGTDLYVATQNFDPNGDMFDPTRYTFARGTSFAAPFVAGAAALVKQRNPQWNAAQIKSAVVNTADTRIDDSDENGQFIQASVLDIGGGKLNTADAVRTNVTIEPSTLSFGVIGASAPPSRSLTLRNFSSAAVSLTLQPRASFGLSSILTLDRTSVAIPAGGSATVTARLDGATPRPGVYEGVINISGGSVPLHVPYLYMVGDGAPYSVLPLEGIGFEGTVNQVVYLTYKVVDQFGVPVRGVRTRARIMLGGGSVEQESGETDDLGIGYADVRLGSQLGDQEVYIAVGDQPNFGVYFDGRARLKPAISSGGVVNLASGQIGQGVAPGSYISIYGRGLSEVTREINTPYLPLALANVSVSFDVPSQRISAPGRVHFVSDGQVNVQVPWELRGANSAIIKVSIGDSSSDVVTVSLNEHSPAVFEFSDPGSGRQLGAVLDSAYGLVTPANPARRNDVVQIYVNGLGPVDNQPLSGMPSPLEPLARTRVIPEVTIGGQRAEVVFSGMTPGAIGLYQINARVPAGAASGLQPLVVTANGIVSKTVNLPIQ
ncbi:MAG TPA: S8 family serine peptidase [Bryobacteraceae bacterium]|nr:S8 family serine peptidase [Bryobacteraceae bacterium]